MKKTLALAISAITFFSSITLNQTLAYAADEPTEPETPSRIERVFNTNEELCMFAYRFYSEAAEICAGRNEYGFNKAPGFQIPPNETWTFNNLHIEFDVVGSFIRVLKGGKLIIDGEDTELLKYDGCIFVVNSQDGPNSLEIRAGTFTSGNGTFAPICYENTDYDDYISLANGSLTRDSLGDIEEARRVFESIIPENYTYIDLSEEPYEEITEIVPVTKWVHKMDPSWFYTLQTWKFRIEKKPEEEPKEIPEEPTPTPEEPTIEPEPEQKVEEKTTEVKSSVPKTPNTSTSHLESASNPEAVLASLPVSPAEVAPETDSARIEASYTLPLIISAVVIYTTLNIIGNREKHKHNY